MKQNTIIAIIRGVHPKDIRDITQCLLENGIDSIEVSLSDEEIGLECIRVIFKEFGDRIHLGVGTVINQSQVDKAINAGARYIITPGWDCELAKYVLANNIEMFPGVFSPGDIMQATSLGIETVKLFPAINLGPSYIKNVKAPFPRTHFMAVGGISKDNIKEYQRAGCSYFAIGSDLVPSGATKEDLQIIKQSAEVYNQLLLEEF
ncbi:bifunctional 4-hydroxy-2-oxoglutarate aldolase/2-dehydro-3-deoxy-phosphogluconate aldolase [Bacillaceae bacterium S4-13-56]